MDAYRIPLEEAVGKCSWCDKTIPDDVPTFGFGGKMKHGIDLSEFEGGAVRMLLLTQEKQVIAIVPTADSEAKRDGKDVMFMVCSEKCGLEMKAALEKEAVSLDDLFQRIDPLHN